MHVPVDQQRDGVARGKLRRAGKAALGGIKTPADVVHDPLHNLTRQRGGFSRGDGGHMATQRLGRRCDALAILGVALRHLRQHRLERVRRQIGAPVENVSIRRQEDGERPAAAAGELCDRALVARVDVRAHVAIDLDRNEQLVDEHGDRGILVRLAVHLMAPVAPDRPDVEVDRPIEPPCQGEHVVAPLLPMHGLLRRRPQVRAGGLGELVAKQGWVGLRSGANGTAETRQDHRRRRDADQPSMPTPAGFRAPGLSGGVHVRPPE